jgi:hypothetical protein
MSLAIRTYTHDKAAPLKSGGETLFKALGHPLVAPLAAALIGRLAQAGSVAFYDPDGHLESFDALYPLASVRSAGFFVQRVEELGRSTRSRPAAPPRSCLPRSTARATRRRSVTCCRRAPS